MIDRPRVPVPVIEHVYRARTCPVCQIRCIPKVQSSGAAAGKQRLGINLISLISVLREEARLPIRTIQWHLDIVHRLRHSLGAIVVAIQRAAKRPKG